MVEPVWKPLAACQERARLGGFRWIYYAARVIAWSNRAPNPDQHTFAVENRGVRWEMPQDQMEVKVLFATPVRDRHLVFLSAVRVEIVTI